MHSNRFEDFIIQNMYADILLKADTSIGISMDTYGHLLSSLFHLSLRVYTEV